MFFSHLDIWEDATARSAAGQMACDEALLQHADRPILRFYEWASPAATFGYAQRLEKIRHFAEGRPLMRRWTGGGVVLHGEDLTLALAIPVSDTVAGMTSMGIYREIHEGLVAALSVTDGGIRLVLPEDCREGAACFQSPVPLDIVLDGLKICGGALRRSKAGVLYQGSLRLKNIPLAAIGGALSRESSRFSIPSKWEAKVASVVEKKYGTASWNNLR